MNERYRGYNQLVILAREDNTDGNMVIGSFSFLYTSGTINGYSDADISGIEVNTTKPVSVLMSSECVDIPPGFNGCDQVVTTALPVAGWGTRYIVPPLYPRQGYLVKIFSHLPANVSVFNSTSSTVKQLRENGFLELLLETEPLTIISTSPVMVIHYGLSYDFDHVNGDAFMTTVPSLDNFANNYIFPSPSYLDNVHYINTLAITIRKDEVTGLRLNGLPIQNKLTFAVHHPLDDYVVIAVNLTGNSQTLKHVNASVFFAGLVYGRGLYLGFGFPIGLTVLPKGDGTCGGSCDDVHHSACVDLLLTKPDMCSDVTMADIYCRKTCGKCAPENGTQSCDDLHHNACANLRVNKPDMCNDSAIANVYCRKTCGKCALTCYHCNLVEDPATCNTTSQCQDGELCISTKVLETDFKLHNRLGCTSQQVCDDITEPIIGKRSEKRSYETKCCKTNLCNRN